MIILQTKATLSDILHIDRVAFIYYLSKQYIKED